MCLAAYSQHVQDAVGDAATFRLYLATFQKRTVRRLRLAQHMRRQRVLHEVCRCAPAPAWPAMWLQACMPAPPQAAAAATAALSARPAGT